MALPDAVIDLDPLDAAGRVGGDRQGRHAAGRQGQAHGGVLRPGRPALEHGVHEKRQVLALLGGNVVPLVGRVGLPDRRGDPRQDVVAAIHPSMLVVGRAEKQEGAADQRGVGLGLHRLAPEQGVRVGGPRIGRAAVLGVGVPAVAIDGAGGLHPLVHGRDGPGQRAAHRDAEDADPLGVDLRLPLQVGEAAPRDDGPMIPAGDVLVGPDGDHARICVQVVPLDQGAPAGVVGAFLPAAAPVERQGGVSAAGPQVEPEAADGPAAAVHVQDRRQALAALRRGIHGIDPHGRFLEGLAREVELPIGNALFHPGRLDLDIQRFSAGVETRPDLLGSSKRRGDEGRFRALGRHECRRAEQHGQGAKKITHVG